jgi:uncharacterized protein YjbI with pentapeptide repeats
MDQTDALQLLTKATYGQIIKDQSFDGLSFSGLNQTGLEFQNCSFCGSSIVEAYFSRCIFKAVNFTASDFTSATFHECKFLDSVFHKTIFFKGTINQCLFEEPSFFETNLSRCGFFGSQIIDQVLIEKSNLSKGQFFNNNFGSIKFEDSDLTLLFLKGCSFKSLSLLRCQASQLIAGSLILNNLKAVDTDLTGSFFSSSDLSSAILSNLTMNGSFFKKTILAGSDLSLSQAEKAIFEEADLSYANLSNIVAPYADFSHANLTGANLSGADLSSACFHRTKELYLDEAKVTGARYTDEVLAKAEDFVPWTINE